MKSLSAHLNESLNESLNEGKVTSIDGKQLGDVIAAMNGYGRGSRTKAALDCESPYENGGYDTFSSAKEMETFVTKNANDTVKGKAVEMPGDYEISFTVAGKFLAIGVTARWFINMDI
jgi:hypothetical protein